MFFRKKCVVCGWVRTVFCPCAVSSLVFLSALWGVFCHTTRSHGRQPGVFWSWVRRTAEGSSLCVASTHSSTSSTRRCYLYCYTWWLVLSHLNLANFFRHKAVLTVVPDSLHQYNSQNQHLCLAHLQIYGAHFVEYYDWRPTHHQLTSVAMEKVISVESNALCHGPCVARVSTSLNLPILRISQQPTFYKAHFVREFAPIQWLSQFGTNSQLASKLETHLANYPSCAPLRSTDPGIRRMTCAGALPVYPESPFGLALPSPQTDIGKTTFVDPLVCLWPIFVASMFASK